MASVDDAYLCRDVGMQVMERLNEAGTVATMGTSITDGSYHFTLGPIYVPQDYISIGKPGKERQVLVTISALPEE